MRRRRRSATANGTVCRQACAARAVIRRAAAGLLRLPPIYSKIQNDLSKKFRYRRDISAFILYFKQ
jgi:hypothetical protein